MRIVPAINAKDEKDAERQLGIIKKIGAERVHLDVTDGKFTAHRAWGSPEAFEKLITSSTQKLKNCEVHLMVENPEEAAAAWCQMGVGRIIVHLEALSSPDTLREMCKEFGVELMVASGPETEADAYVPYIPFYKFFQVLTVAPGKAGQTFDERALEKIVFLKTEAPRATIEVDGGINPEIARACKAAGADEIVSASYILENTDPAQAYRNLTAI